MKKALIQRFGSPDRQYTEEGERVTEWKLKDTHLDLYHGSKRDSPQLYFEPKRRK